MLVSVLSGHRFSFSSLADEAGCHHVQSTKGLTRVMHAQGPLSKLPGSRQSTFAHLTTSSG